MIKRVINDIELNINEKKANEIYFPDDFANNINDSSIYSDDLAQQRANYELRKVSILKTTMTLSVAYNPLLFVNNLITIVDEHYKINRARFLIQSISFTIGEGNAMSISCSNIANFNSEIEVI